MVAPGLGIIFIEKVDHPLEQSLPFSTQGFAGRDEASNFLLAVRLGGNEAHPHT